jgi:hypothetical protein
MKAMGMLIGDEQYFSSNVVLSSFQALAYFLMTTSNLILFYYQNVVR